MRLRKFDAHYFAGAGRFEAIPDQLSPEKIMAQAKDAAARAKRALDRKNNKGGPRRSKDEEQIYILCD
jgi:hypothetical protein